MLAWMTSHKEVLAWLFGLSLVAFLATMVAIPILIVRMPADYFVRRRSIHDVWRGRHPAVRLAALMAKNLLGAVFVVAGLAMFVLPGQGIITLLIGISLLDFPGKRAVERAIVRQPVVHWIIDRIRTKAGRPPLVVPGKSRKRCARAECDPGTSEAARIAVRQIRSK
jgi:hypothetical protein